MVGGLNKPLIFQHWAWFTFLPREAVPHPSAPQTPGQGPGPPGAGGILGSHCTTASHLSVRPSLRGPVLRRSLLDSTEQRCSRPVPASCACYSWQLFGLFTCLMAAVCLPHWNASSPGARVWSALFTGVTP